MFADSHHIRRIASQPIHLMPIPTKENLSDNEILKKLEQEREDEKIQNLLITQFGEKEGNKTFQKYIGNEPRSIKWNRSPIRKPLPVFNQKTQQKIKASDLKFNDT